MTKTVDDMTNDEKLARIRAAMGTQEERDEQREQTYRKNNPPAGDAQQHDAGENDAANTSIVRKIRKANTHLNWTEAQEAEKKQGEGLDLGIRFFLRKGDSNEFYECDEDGNGSYGIKLTFQGINYLAARTGGGKTLFECALATKILFDYDGGNKPEKKHVVFITLEEPAIAIKKHIVTGYLKHKYPAEHITEKDVTAALLGKLDDDDKQQKIAEVYDELTDRLEIIDKHSFKEAAKRVIDAGESNDNAKGEEIDEASTAAAVIIDAVDEYKGAKNVVFFIDYVQLMHDADGARNAATYKELKAIARHLIDAANEPAFAVMFVAAQVDRTAVKNASTYKTQREKHAAEFYEMIAENLREAADLEQSGQKILYFTIDGDVASENTGEQEFWLNMRLLKNRNGHDRLYASAKIDFARRAIDFNNIDKPTLPTLDGSTKPPTYRLNPVKIGVDGKTITKNTPSKTTVQEKPANRDGEKPPFVFRC